MTERRQDYIKIAEHMATTNECLKNLTEQFIKQNGRVTALEEKVDVLKSWRSYVLGIGGGLGGVCTCLGLAIAWVAYIKK